MQYTRKIKQECQKMGIDVKAKAFADLISMGWNETDVFIALDFYRATYSEQYNKKQLELFLNDPSMVRYLSGQVATMKRKRKDSEPEQEETDQVKQMTKEDVLTELMNMLNTLDRKDPRRVEVLMKYSELQRFKQEEIRDEEKLAHFYVPIYCKICNLYQAAQTKKHKTENETDSDI